MNGHIDRAGLVVVLGLVVLWLWLAKRTLRPPRVVGRLAVWTVLLLAAYVGWALLRALSLSDVP